MELVRNSSSCCDTFFKIVVGLLLAGLVAFSNLVTRLSVLHLTDGYDAATAATSTTLPTFNSYYYALASSIWIAEGINWLICAKSRWFELYSNKKQLTMIETIQCHWQILLVDALNLLGEVFLLLVVFTSVDAVTCSAVAMMPFISQLWARGINFGLGVQKRGESVEVNVIFTWIGAVFSVGFYLFTIVAYVLNYKPNWLVIIALLVYPFLASASFYFNWIRPKYEFREALTKEDDGFRSKDRENPDSCRNNLNFISATIRLLLSFSYTYAIAALYGVSSPLEYGNIFTYPTMASDNTMLWIGVILVGGLCSSYFGLCGCQIGFPGISMALPCYVAIITQIILVAVGCQTTAGGEELFWNASPIQCVEAQPNVTMDSVVLAVVYLILGLPSMVIACGYIHTAIPIQLPLWNICFLRDCFVSGAGMINTTLLLNQKRRFRIVVDEKTLKEQDGQNSIYERFFPYIYVCPTLYREDVTEMRTLMKSLLRINDDRVETQISFDKNQRQNKYRYKFEIHIMFDNCFLADLKDEDKKFYNNSEQLGKRPVNDFVRDLIKEVMIKEIEEMDEYGFDHKQKELKSFIQPLPATTWPYGIRLNYKIKHPDDKSEGVDMQVHLKDPKKIAKGKRWSQCMYFFYLLQYKFGFRKQQQHDERGKLEYTPFILALDGDIDFKADALHSVLNKTLADPRIGVCCGRIEPQGAGIVYHYQRFEYSVGHWLQKTTEHVLGCVLCSPGCFSLIRGKAALETLFLKPGNEAHHEKQFNNEDGDSVRIPTRLRYAQRPKPENARSYIQWDLGEDRWMCTLLIQDGWRIEFVAISDSLTNAPIGLDEFFNQRRRWVPSTLFNTFDVVASWRHTTRVNDSVSIGYIFYQVVLNVGSLIAPMTIILLTAGGLESIIVLVGSSLDWWISIIVAILPPAILVILCTYWRKREDIQHAYILVMSYIYCLFMLAVLLVIIAGFVATPEESAAGGWYCGFCEINNQFFIFLVMIYVIAGLLHPTELGTMPSGIVYFMMLPTMFIFLNIYSYMGLNNLSWGTREDKTADEKKNESKPKTVKEYQCSMGGCWCCYSTEVYNVKVIEQEESLKKSDVIEEIVESQEKKEERDIKMMEEEEAMQRRMTAKKRTRTIRFQDEKAPKFDKWEDQKDEVEPLKKERKSLFKSLQRTVTMRNTKTGKITTETRTVHEDPDYFIPYDLLGAGNYQAPQFAREETLFWEWLITDNKEILDGKNGPLRVKEAVPEKVQEDINGKLMKLRNDFLLIFFGMNLIWLVLMIVLKIESEDLNVTITIKGYNGAGAFCGTPCANSSHNMLALAFLLFYFVLITIQFICMLAHRWTSIVTYTSLLNMWKLSILPKETAAKLGFKEQNVRRYATVARRRGTSPNINIAHTNKAYEDEYKPYDVSPTNSSRSSTMF